MISLFFKRQKVQSKKKINKRAINRATKTTTIKLSTIHRLIYTVRGVSAIYLGVYFSRTVVLRRCVQCGVSGCLLSEMPLPDAINYLQPNSSFLHLVR